jgi:DNA-binding GntR family transcriptional regulator
MMADHSISIEEESELLRRKSLKDGVFELVHERIVAGQVAPGEWLRQEEIASQLGVSQTPVREALDMLVSVGLAERVPYRGVRVPALTAEDIVDAYVLRLVLERPVAHLAALNISPGALDELYAIMKQSRPLVRLQEMSQHRQLNKRFHLAVARASGNTLLMKLYEMVSNLFPDWRLYEYMFRHPELLENSLEREAGEHQAIVDALASHDPELAVQQVVTHIKNLSTELVEFLYVPAQLLSEKEKQAGI